MRQRGIMVIELLLVIAVAVLIFALGLERYRAYHRSMQLDLVSSDVLTLQQALNRYYEKLPCNGDGVLQAPLNEDVIRELGRVETARSPYINSYHAYIEGSEVKIKNNKPVYRLVVSADVDSKFNGILGYLTQRMNALRYQGQTIYWSLLPNTLTTEKSSVLWVMNVSRNQFRKLKNNWHLAGQQGSHSYCFR